MGVDDLDARRHRSEREVSCAHRFPGYRVGGPGLRPAIAGENGGVDTKSVHIAACFFRLTELLEKGLGFLHRLEPD